MYVPRFKMPLASIPLFIEESWYGLVHVKIVSNAFDGFSDTKSGGSSELNIDSKYSEPKSYLGKETFVSVANPGKALGYTVLPAITQGSWSVVYRGLASW